VTIEAGELLLHYRLIEKIGEGGMGAVWKAEDTRLRRHVALKFLPQEMSADPDRRARFEREAQAVAALNHPNIVTLHSVERADTPAGSVHFITMELVEGRTLSETLPNGGFPLQQLLEIAVPLVDAVSSAHRSGITHRDLKPDNLMVDSEDRLRVLDFGLAKARYSWGVESATQAETAAAVTEEGTILGTVTYMSPEQAEGKNVDPRSDIFSLGTILYEMATGARPFKGDTNVSTIGAILKDEPVSVVELKPSLPNHLGRIIRRCLAKDPDRRYQTALDLRNELEELKNEVVSKEHRTHPSGGAPRSGTLSRPILIGSVAAAMAIVAIVTLTIRKGPESSAPAYVPRPITSAIGQEAYVNWSPDSSFITFAQTRGGSMDIMVQPLAGGEAQVRAGGPGDEGSPHWSPDGKYIAYISSSEPGMPVFLIPPHGGAARKLVSTNIRTLDIDKASAAMGDRPWTRDSQALLISRVDESGQIAVYRVDRERGEAVQVTFPPTGNADLSASHSFDGDRIVFQRRSQGKAALMTMPAGGGEPQVLLDDGFNNAMPAWRPDNRRVLFLSDRGGGAINVWEISVDGSSTRQLTFETSPVTSLAVSAADRVAYQPFWHDTFLFAVDVASGERRQLTDHTHNNFGARFSPDGRSVAYHSTRTGNSEVWLHHLDGRPETRITDNSDWDVYPDWSPDGQLLSFVSDRSEARFKIFIANADGGGERLLIDQPVSVDTPLVPVDPALISRWSPDGEQIAFLVDSGKGQALWVVQANGQGVRELLGNVTDFDWYRDSSHGLYTRPHGSESELLAVNLETGEERSLFIGPLTEIDVAPDGSAVAFCSGRGHMNMGLVQIRLDPPVDSAGLPEAAGDPEWVVRTEGSWHVHNGGWSADSKQLVYTRDRDYGDIYELVEKKGLQ
jgi:serine/threonine protein kinase/WD40 repeat protein